MKLQLANRLRLWRVSEGLSLQEVADLTGVDIGHLSRVERGLKGVSPRTKVLIARRLGVPIREIFDVDGVEP